MSSELKNIGHPIMLSSRSDPNYRISDYVRIGMRLVDLIPVDFFYDLCLLLKVGFRINYEYDYPIKSFKSGCEMYKIPPYSGVRLWLSDETVHQEDISHIYEDSLLQSLLDKLGEFRRFFKSGVGSMLRAGQHQALTVDGQQLDQQKTGLANTLTSYLASGTSGVADWAGDLAGAISGSKDFGQLTKNMANVAGNIFVTGKDISLPKIWAHSQYSPNFQFTVKLISPYGDPEAIKKYIVNPLIYLLLLSSPKSNDGLTYGWPPLLKINSYGIANINVGYIENISITRGGTDVQYNKYKQPLSVRLNISMRPITTGFASIISDNNSTLTDSDINVIDTPFESDNIMAGNPSSGALLNTVGGIIQSFRPIRDANTPVTPSNIAPTAGNVQQLPPSLSSPLTNLNSTTTTSSVFNSLPDTIKQQFGINSAADLTTALNQGVGNYSPSQVQTVIYGYLNPMK